MGTQQCPLATHRADLATEVTSVLVGKRVTSLSGNLEDHAASSCEHCVV